MVFCKPIRKCATAALFAAVLLAPFSSVADAGVAVVTAKGSGETVAEAKKDAGRAAIQQVVGELMDAETLVENDELVKDRILTYSGAYLEDMEVVGKPIRRKSTGLVEVTVTATVRKTQLEKKLKAENVATKKVKGGKLFAQATSKAQETGDAAALADKVFEDVPGCFWKVEMLAGEDGSPAIEADANGNVVANVRVSLDEAAYRSWAKRAMAVFDRIADDKTDETVELASVNTRTSGPGGRTVERIARELPREPPWSRFDNEKRRPGERPNRLLVCIPHPFRPTANALVYRIYWFAAGEKADRIRKIVAERFPRQASVSGTLLAGDEVLGIAAGKALKDLKAPTFGSRGPQIRRFGPCYADDTVDLYKDRAQTWILVPSVTGHPGWGGPFNPSVEFVLPLGRFDADDLDDATDVRLSLDFE